MSVDKTLKQKTESESDSLYFDQFATICRCARNRWILMGDTIVVPGNRLTKVISHSGNLQASILAIAMVAISTSSARAQSANWFVDSMTQINSSIGVLIPELRRHTTMPAVRASIGQFYVLESESNSLVDRTRRGESYEAVAAAYQQLDTRWRDAAFRIRAGGEITPEITRRLNELDSAFRTIDRRLGLSPPIDRVRLRDLMIVTLTYMDAMFDDIRLSQGYSAQSEALLVQGRLLREKLRQESYRMEGAEFDEIVGSFTEFVRLWRAYAQSLHQLNDPHIHRRLESIRRQGEEVFATLRIPAAPDRNELIFLTQRLPGELSSLADQVSRWGANRLTRDQFRFIETCRALSERARRLATEVGRGGVTSTAQSMFREIDAAWNDGIRLMATVDPASGLQASLARVNTTFTALHDFLGTGSWRGRTELLTLAASIETSAETFNIDIQRFRRLMEPLTFRNAIGTASDQFYAATQQFHRQISDGTDDRTIAITAKLLVDRWNELTRLVNGLPNSGLAAARAELIYTNYRELQPLVTQASAMLVQ